MPTTGSRASACRTCRATTVERGFDVDGYENIVDALADGNGVILVLPHLGGWEWAGRWIAEQGHQITVVVEKIDPPELFEWFVELRSALGMNVVALGPGAGTTVMRALRDNHVVCLLADRDLQGGGPEVEFFGERTTLPAGPGDAVDAHRRPDPAHRGVLHRSSRRSPRLGAPAACRSSVSRSDSVTTCSASPNSWPRNSRSSSGGRRRSGTCSRPTGRATPGTGIRPA